MAGVIFDSKYLMSSGRSDFLEVCDRCHETVWATFYGAAERLARILRRPTIHRSLSRMRGGRAPSRRARIAVRPRHPCIGVIRNVRGLDGSSGRRARKNPHGQAPARRVTKTEHFAAPEKADSAERPQCRKRLDGIFPFCNREPVRRFDSDVRHSITENGKKKTLCPVGNRKTRGTQGGANHDDGESARTSDHRPLETKGRPAI